MLYQALFFNISVMINPCLLFSFCRNFQSSALFEDSVESEGIKTESSLGSTVSACKKVLCSNSVLDTCDYWLKNDKALCRVNFLEDQHDGGCTPLNLVN
ncbi:A-kinase anchor protein SPHKAP isoform X1 [Tachysurus ichikawai]